MKIYIVENCLIGKILKIFDSLDKANSFSKQLVLDKILNENEIVVYDFEVE
jgi:hypothetical protein